MKRLVRFNFDNSWSRWFGEDEDFRLMRNQMIDKVEVLQEMTPIEFADLHDDMAAQIEIE